MSDARLPLLYDADCGFCRWALGWVLRWDHHRRLRPVALQSAEADDLLSELDHERRVASWHLLDVENTLRSGGTAAAPLLRVLPGGGPAAALMARAPGLTESAYRSVVRRRNALGHRVTAAAKARADALIAERS